MHAHRPGAVRTCAQVVALVAVVVLSSCSTREPHTTPPSTAAPSGGCGSAATSGGTATTLADWQLTLPVSGSKGHAATVKPARSSPPWFIVNGSDLAFWAPVNGATTPNSDHTRTELDSVDDFPAGTVRHTLDASLTVCQVPTEDPDVIVGQIHGAEDISSVPFVMLSYARGTIKVVVKQERSGTNVADYRLLTDVPLGAPLDYRISDNGDGTLTFTATCNGRTATASAPVPAAFTGATVRFQAGAYQQARSDGGTATPDDGARVTFSALRTS